jgi:predicted naringenin-chalcone synthase
MLDVRIVGLGTANPPLRLSQEESYKSYTELMPLSEEAKSLLQRIFVENQSIGYRYFAADAPTDALQDSQDELIARYQRFGVQVSVEAANRALNQAGLVP